MAMQMESSICTHSEYVTAKGTGGFTVRFLFLLSSKNFSKSVDKQQSRWYIKTVERGTKPEQKGETKNEMSKMQQYKRNRPDGN